MIWITFIAFGLLSMGLILIPFRTRLFKTSSPATGVTPPSASLLILALAVSLPVLAYSLYALLDDRQVPTTQVSSDDSSLAENHQLADINLMITGLQEKLAAKPGDIEGWNLLARSYLYIKDYQGALMAFQHVAELLPNNADLQQQIAETQGLLDQQSSPMNRVEKNSPVLINDQPVDVLAMVERLRKKLEVNPNQPAGWIMLGRSYKYLGQLEKSLNAYQKASQLNPDNSDIKDIINALNNTLANKENDGINAASSDDQTTGLTRQYMKAGDFQKAIALLEKSLQQDANDIDNIIMLADALAMSNAGQFNERTQTLINRALTLDPNHAVALWLAGMAEEKNQQYQGALEHWNKLLGLMSKDNPDQPILQSMILRVEQKINDGNKP